MSDLHRHEPMDLTVQPDQGPFHETDDAQDPGVERPGQGADEAGRPRTGDPATPGESTGTGNADGLVQGLDS